MNRLNNAQQQTGGGSVETGDAQCVTRDVTSSESETTKMEKDTHDLNDDLDNGNIEGEQKSLLPDNWWQQKFSLKIRLYGQTS